ncbi:MAG: hypothetical protein RIR18_94 [Pseudomonadota bacterium]|jgi:zinc protease
MSLKTIGYPLNSWLLIAVSLLTLFTPLANAAAPIQHWVTPSGTPVYFAETKGLPIVDVRVDFNAGSAQDPVGQSGLAALTHTLLDLGAGSDDEASIARKFADLGAQLGGSVEMDRASISLRSLSASDKLPPAMALLRQILSAPHFDAKVLERERQRSMAELKDALTRPEVQANRAFWLTVYGDHPYGRQMDEASLTALTRDEVVTFFRQHYTRNNAVITLVGDLDRAHAEKLTGKLSEVLAPADLASVASIPEVSIAAGKTVQIEHSASQAHILLGLPTIPRGHADFFPLLVGNYTLGGGGFVSRLMQEVREKRGFAYSVYSYVAPMRQAGPFQIGLQTKRDQAADALKLTRSVLESFVAEGPSDKELAAAKANLVGGFPLRLDSNKKLLENVAVIGYYGLPLDWLDTYQAKISKVSRDEIRQAFKRHIRGENLNTVIVGGGE